MTTTSESNHEHHGHDDTKLMANLTSHINTIKPKQFALCYIHDPRIAGGRHEGDVIAWGLVMRRGVTILDDDGTPVGLYDSVEDACARMAHEYEATNTRILWLTPEFTDPPTNPPERHRRLKPRRPDAPTPAPSAPRPSTVSAPAAPTPTA